MRLNYYEYCKFHGLNYLSLSPSSVHIMLVSSENFWYQHVICQYVVGVYSVLYRAVGDSMSSFNY